MDVEIIKHEADCVNNKKELKRFLLESSYNFNIPNLKVTKMKKPDSLSKMKAIKNRIENYSLANIETQYVAVRWRFSSGA